MVIEPYPDHKCGKVLDFCTYHDTTIYFCLFCKKVIKASKEPQIKITFLLDSDLEQHEYSEENLKQWI